MLYKISGSITLEITISQLSLPTKEPTLLGNLYSRNYNELTLSLPTKEPTLLGDLKHKIQPTPQHARFKFKQNEIMYISEHLK